MLDEDLKHSDLDPSYFRDLCEYAVRDDVVSLRKGRETKDLLVKFHDLRSGVPGWGLKFVLCGRSSVKDAGPA